MATTTSRTFQDFDIQPLDTQVTFITPLGKRFGGGEIIALPTATNEMGMSGTEISGTGGIVFLNGVDDSGAIQHNLRVWFEEDIFVPEGTTSQEIDNLVIQVAQMQKCIDTMCAFLKDKFN
tara:strand:- start:3641 stop:4003 length:363 start_codon:yes stop_codon:yes gene_type:complete